jgi:SAM-dependent methyltransferase
MANEAFRFSGGDALNYEQYLGPLLFEPSALEFISYLGLSGNGDGDPGSPDASCPAAVLEIGSGTGRLTRHLRQYFPTTTQLIASDISPDMLELARRQLEDPSIEFQVADAQQLLFSDNSFDLVVCQYGLMFLPDKLKGFTEIFRVIKPGGRFVFSTWDKLDNMPLLDLIFNKLVIPFFKGEDTTRFRVPFSLYEPTILLDLLQESGFTHRSVFPIHFKGRSMSPEEVVNGLFLKHPLGRQVAEKKLEAVKPMAEEMLRRIAGQFGASDLLFDLKALIGSGRK